MTCIIDGSHDRAINLSLAIVKFAETKGYVVPDDAQELYDLVERDSCRLISELTGADSEGIYWLSDEAQEWLNDNVANGGWYTVEDSCLYFEMDEG